ncbi:MAG: heterocyst-inhibiting protein PatX [Microcoleus sp.]
MMRTYSCILMSSLLLSSTPVNAQSLQIAQTFFSQDKSVPELLTSQADPNSSTETDKDSAPERGSGR